MEQLSTQNSVEVSYENVDPKDCLFEIDGQKLYLVLSELGLVNDQWKGIVIYSPEDDEIDDSYGYYDDELKLVYINHGKVKEEIEEFSENINSLVNGTARLASFTNERSSLQKGFDLAKDVWSMWGKVITSSEKQEDVVYDIAQKYADLDFHKVSLGRVADYVRSLTLDKSAPREQRQITMSRRHETLGRIMTSAVGNLVSKIVLHEFEHSKQESNHSDLKVTWGVRSLAALPIVASVASIIAMNNGYMNPEFAPLVTFGSPIAGLALATTVILGEFPARLAMEIGAHKRQEKEWMKFRDCIKVKRNLVQYNYFPVVDENGNEIYQP